MKEGQDKASRSLRQPEECHPTGHTYAYIDPATSLTTSVQDAQQLSRGERIYNALYPIHSTAIGGRIYDIILSLAGLVLAILGCSGLWTFLIRLRFR